MPDDTPPGDSRKLFLVVIAAALIASWITVGRVVGYDHLPASFVGGMIAFDLFILYFVWRMLGPRNRR